MPRKRRTELPPLDINSDESSIGSRIANIRKKLGLTQIDLAERIGIQRTQVTDYEIGRLHLSDEMVIRFAIALSVSSDLILGLKKLESDSMADLKITKRLKAIEELPASDQKKVLQNLDLIIQGIKNK